MKQICKSGRFQSDPDSVVKCVIIIKSLLASFPLQEHLVDCTQKLHALSCSLPDELYLGTI